MEGGIDANAILDYIEFQIFPSQNRYGTSIYNGNNFEIVMSGPLEPLLLHSAKIRALHSRGSDAKYKLSAPEDLSGGRWFTKSTLLRFLQIIGSLDVLNATASVRNEIAQLEEARRFHLSLYVKGPQNHVEGEEADDASSGDRLIPKAGTNSGSSADSKSELLRAMDFRLTALRGELAAAFGQAAVTTCSKDEINAIEEFCSHFGATDLRNSLGKLVELSREKCRVDFPSEKQSTIENDKGNGRIRKNEENSQVSKPSNSDVPVKFGCSPAKAAQVERQSSSESEESSYSSEEEQPSIERSRTLIRSASPRRSASPMRRIQIGRSGSRRSTPLTIKSLSYFPRVSHKDAAEHSTDEEASEQPSKKSESNHMRRMSVQDAINLFESKQRDQTVDTQKTKSLLNASVNANKSVLRRWSAGTGESSNECPQGTISDNSVPLTSNNLESDEAGNGLAEAKPENGHSSNGNPLQPAEVDVKMESPEQSEPSVECIEENGFPSQAVGNGERLTASAEWSRQKEAELNQLLMKMMETKPVKYQNGASENSKSQNFPNEQRGGFYNHYKEKRNEKLLRETAGKQAEKEKQFKAMQKSLDERKSEMVSANTNAGGKKRIVKTSKSQKALSQPANNQKETSKPSVIKKASPKTSPLPATRKSWPSTPSPRPTGTSPAKTPAGMTSAGTTPTRGKSQPKPAVPRSNPKVETAQLQLKSLKATQGDKSTVVKDVNIKMQQPIKKTTKPTKPKVQTVAGDPTPSGKPSLYSKVTRKSSVVPVESKPFLRKGSGIGSGVVSPVLRTKVASQPEESLGDSEDQMQKEEIEIVSSSSDQVIQQPKVDLEPVKDHVESESEIQGKSQETCEDIETFNQVTLGEDDSFQKMTECLSNAEAAEELTIPPTAWVEIEEHEDQAVPGSDGICQIESSSSLEPVGMPCPRVRHSLSQMLLEESSDPDVIEWGNAENPPAIVYQKDAPKGLKRLLKFARKSKTDGNSTGCSSPLVFSEGEDDAEESRSTSKRNTDNLLKKATLHSKNYRNQKTSSHEKNLAAQGLYAQANLSKSAAQSLSDKLQEGQNFASISATTKATRSFFSLSAFKGGKQNDIKFR